MISISIILMILAVVFFVLATANAPLRINCVAAGLLCWSLTVLLGMLPIH